VTDDRETRRLSLLSPNRYSDVEVAEYRYGFPVRRLTAGRARKLVLTCAIDRVFRLTHLYMNTPHEGLLYLVNWTIIASPGGTPVTKYATSKYLGAPTPFATPATSALWEPKDKWFDTVNFAPSAKAIPLDIVTFMAGGSLRLDLYYTGQAVLSARWRPWQLASDVDGFTALTPEEKKGAWR
jgi:hypothetical protein